MFVHLNLEVCPGQAAGKRVPSSGDKIWVVMATEATGTWPPECKARGSPGVPRPADTSIRRLTGGQGSLQPVRRGLGGSSRKARRA